MSNWVLHLVFAICPVMLIMGDLLQLEVEIGWKKVWYQFVNLCSLFVDIKEIYYSILNWVFHPVVLAIEDLLQLEKDVVWRKVQIAQGRY